jgi:hypothetical protein
LAFHKRHDEYAKNNDETNGIAKDGKPEFDGIVIAINGAVPYPAAGPNRTRAKAIQYGPGENERSQQ